MALAFLELGVHTALTFLSPVVIALLARPLLGERGAPADAAAVASGLGGTLMIVRPAALFGGGGAGSGSGSALSPVGVALVVAGATCAGLTMLVVRKIGKRESPLVLALYFHSFSAVSGVTACAAGVAPGRPVTPDAREALLLLLISLTSFAGQILLNASYSRLPATRAAALNYLQVVCQ